MLILFINHILINWINGLITLFAASTLQLVAGVANTNIHIANVTNITNCSSNCYYLLWEYECYFVCLFLFYIILCVQTQNSPHPVWKEAPACHQVSQLRTLLQPVHEHLSPLNWRRIVASYWRIRAPASPCWDIMCAAEQIFCRESTLVIWITTCRYYKTCNRQRQTHVLMGVDLFNYV